MWWAVGKPESPGEAGVAVPRRAWIACLCGAFSVVALFRGLAGASLSLDPLDFSAPHLTTALFWEMHMGDAPEERWRLELAAMVYET